MKPMGRDDGTPWSSATDFGTTATWMYVEDSRFVDGVANDCYASGKQVFRYNSITDSGLQQHGLGHSSSSHGCRAIEIYNNSIDGGMD